MKNQKHRQAVTIPFFAIKDSAITDNVLIFLYLMARNAMTAISAMEAKLVEMANVSKGRLYNVKLMKCVVMVLAIKVHVAPAQIVLMPKPVLNIAVNGAITIGNVIEIQWVSIKIAVKEVVCLPRAVAAQTAIAPI